MKVLVTGSRGFIGRHVVDVLKSRGHEVFEYDINSSNDDLREYVNNCESIIHLAGSNRPKNNSDFYSNNYDLTKSIVDYILACGIKRPILFVSSIHADSKTDYGVSKKMAEEYLFSSGLPIIIYRLTNVFGPGCRPYYNSVVATFCENVSNDLPLSINDPHKVIDFVFVDDVAKQFVFDIENGKFANSRVFYSVSPSYKCTINKLASLLRYFKCSILSDCHLPFISNEFEFKLFLTFCSYFTEKSKGLNFKSDDRGYFKEIFKSSKLGQISVNYTLPGISKGGHYHTYKREIFYTILGNTKITQRNIYTGKIFDNYSRGGQNEFVEIDPYFLHTMSNVGDSPSYTLIWISEVYDPDNPDTFTKI